MAQIREARKHIVGDALTSGLDMSAGKDMINETQFYRMEGVYADTDGTLTKRMAPVQWGSVIREPTAVRAGENEQISKVLIVDEPEWDSPTITGENANITLFRGAVQTSAWQTASGGTASTARAVKPGEKYNDDPGHSGDASLSLNLRATNASAGALAVVRFAVRENEQYGFAITNLGFAVETTPGNFLTVAGAESLVDGEPHNLIVSVDNTALMRVFVDGVEVLFTISHGVNPTDGNFVKVDVASDNSLDPDPFVLQMSAFMLKDRIHSTSDEAYVPVSVDAITNIKEIKSASASEVVSLLVQGDKYLWYDYALSELWRPLAFVGKDKAHFGKFRGDTIVCSFDATRETAVYQVNGQTREVTKLDAAPNIRFTAQFGNRLWGAGDVDYPLRLYFSGDRQPNLWYNPNDPDNPVTVDAELGAGYFEFPGTKNRAQITYVSGDFFGSLLVATTEDVYILTGSSPADFQRRRLSGALGAAGIGCGINVFNDYWLMNENGISSVTATDKFGDLESGKLSMPIRELFNTDKTTDVMLDPAKLNNAKMVYLQKNNLAFLWAQEAAREDPGVFYVANLDTKKWSGPWREEITALEVVKVRSPLKEAVLYGTIDGKVMRLTSSMYSDDTALLVSPEINGRSIDPRIATMKKTFKNYRLEIAPTGAWSVTFKYKIDDGDWKTFTKYLADPDKHAVLGTHSGWTSATTGTTKTKSDTQAMVIEFPIDQRGHSIKYEIETTAPRLRFKRWQLDMHVAGYERD